MRAIRNRRFRITAYLTALAFIVAFVWVVYRAQPRKPAFNATAYPKIQAIEPPEKGFFAKELSLHGIPIKASSIVANDELFILE